MFNESNNPDMSTIHQFSAQDHHASARKDGKTYTVQTISLNDLLKKYSAPSCIDYLSIDTEGSEYDILSNLDFDRYNFRVITCEHNHSPNRELIHELLTSKGYKRKFENISLFDDWYVNCKN
jgi:FkbM family methyltransferase